MGCAVLVAASSYPAFRLISLAPLHRSARKPAPMYPPRPYTSSHLSGLALVFPPIRLALAPCISPPIRPALVCSQGSALNPNTTGAIMGRAPQAWSPMPPRADQCGLILTSYHTIFIPRHDHTPHIPRHSHLTPGSYLPHTTPWSCSPHFAPGLPSSSARSGLTSRHLHAVRITQGRKGQCEADRKGQCGQCEADR